MENKENREGENKSYRRERMQREEARTMGVSKKGELG